MSGRLTRIGLTARWRRTLTGWRIQPGASGRVFWDGRRRRGGTGEHQIGGFIHRADVGEFCPVPVVRHLSELRGPVSGRYRLPRDLDPTADTWYDLADRWARRRLMITTLSAAATVEELSGWVDRVSLEQAWPTLYLPLDVRAAWEARHPSLAALAAPNMQS